jgi:hypothetical protein
VTVTVKAVGFGYSVEYWTREALVRVMIGLSYRTTQLGSANAVSRFALTVNRSASPLFIRTIGIFKGIVTLGYGGLLVLGVGFE